MRIPSPADGSPGAAAAVDKLIATFLGPGLAVDLLAVIDRSTSHDTRAFPARELEAGLLRSERVRLEEAGIEVAVLLRVSAMVEAHPEVAEMDLNPVIVGPDGQSSSTLGCASPDTPTRVDRDWRNQRVQGSA